MTLPAHEEKLLPCPFCGSDNVQVHGGTDDIRAWVECGRCGAEASYHEDRSGAIQLWNTRSACLTRQSNIKPDGYLDDYNVFYPVKVVGLNLRPIYFSKGVDGECLY